MSVQAIAWALEQQEVRDPEIQLVLMCLANYADADGRNAFPAVSRLARDSRLSERSIQRHLKTLQRMDLIRRGNQAIAAAHIQRADRRPTVYDLAIERGVTQSPREVNGVSHSHPAVDKSVDNSGHGVTDGGSRGDRNASTGCQALSPDPSFLDPSYIDPLDARARVSPTDSRANPEQRKEFIRQLKQRAAQPFESAKRERR